MRILIADDDPISRRLLESTLRKLGHDVIAVENGRAACDALLAPDAPRFAILDWMMPELDGLAVCRAVRSRPAPYVYVILLTSRGAREDIVQGLAAQADDFLTKPFDVHELQARIQSGRRILDLQASLLETQAALHHEATHDRLTGLWNRGHILDHLSAEMARAGRTGHPVTVALVDVDHFKAINDTFGHDAGDSVLRAVGERMRGVLRRTDAIGRYGGEEFLIVLGPPGPRGSVESDVALERVRRAVAETPFATGIGPLHATVSIGAAAGTAATDLAPLVIAAADRALYRAKAEGRNRLVQAGSLDVDDPAPQRVNHDVGLSLEPELLQNS